MLAGTLLLPIWSELAEGAGRRADGGSGPTDRDGNNPLVPMRIDLLKQIAELLATAGIATPALRQARRRRFDSQRRRLDRRAGALLRLGQFRRRRGGRPCRAAAARRDQALCHRPAGPQRRRAARAGRRCRTMRKHPPHALVLAATPGRPLADIVRAQIARAAPQSRSAAPSASWRPSTPPATCPPTCRAELAALFPPYAGPFLQRPPDLRSRAGPGGLDAACLLLHGAADAQVVPMDDIQPLIDALGKRDAPGEAVVFPRSATISSRSPAADRSRLRGTARARRRRPSSRAG